MQRQESDRIDQSGLTKEQSTEPSSTHQAIASAATRDIVWFPRQTATLYTNHRSTLLQMQRFHQDTLTSMGETNLRSCQPILHTVHLTLVLGDAPPAKCVRADGTMGHSRMER